jgi:hypothetical protein
VSLSVGLFVPAPTTGLVLLLPNHYHVLIIYLGWEERISEIVHAKMLR